LPRASSTAIGATIPPPTMPDVAAAKMRKHSLVIRGHGTSISLEDAFWSALKEIAVRRAQPIAALVAQIDETRGAGNLSSAIRIFVLQDFQARLDLSEPVTGDVA
jgi:predicted DNA-binding ribbon-helix-helix protein